ncbi:MAG: CBS domain-containing protein [Candidatus Micrarchaeota archaeon]|nr:CBS domain-containing protein [Candidatus Micrarchaeota archaeon]
MASPVKVRVGECMTVGVLTLPETASVREAAKLLSKSHVGSVIVTRAGKAVGILTERDIVYNVIAKEKDSGKTRLKDVMSKPLRVISAGQSLEEAALALKENKVKRLPVVDAKGQLVGIVSEGDLLRVYPGVLDLTLQAQDLGPVDKESFSYTGACAKCGLYSEDLRLEGGKLLCEECREEEEV